MLVSFASEHKGGVFESNGILKNDKKFRGGHLWKITSKNVRKFFCGGGGGPSGDSNRMFSHLNSPECKLRKN